MDAPLRQRLIGAAVLIAIAVIFLPMLLEGPGPSGNTEVALEIPPPGAAPDLETRMLSVNPPAHAPVAEAVSAPEIEAAPVVGTPSDVSVIARPDTPAPAAVPALTPEPAAPVATPAPAPLPAAPEATERARFVVQLGAYSEESNARDLIQRLAPLGIRAELSAMESAGRTMYRVRSQGFERREDAEAARVRATSAVPGLEASVSALSLPAPTAPAVAPAAAAAAAFAVQLGVFKSAQAAAALVDRARAAGFAAYTETLPIAGVTQFRVRVGPELRRENAERTRDSIKQKLAIDGNVVTHP